MADWSWQSGSYRPPTTAQYFNQLLQQIPVAGNYARQMVDAMGAAAGQSPYAYAPEMLKEAVTRQMQGGMSDAEYAGERSNIGRQFNSAVGQLAAKGARGGFYNPAGVASAAGGRPAASLANSLQNLSATRARMQREGASSAAGTLAQMSQYPMQDWQNRQQAIGEYMGEGLRRMQTPRTTQRYGTMFSGIPG